MEYILEMDNIVKEFPGVMALNNVSLNVKKGEVHALMGENGAGKSTLMKILCGIYKADSGEIRLNGEKVNIESPSDSIKQGISMIHQELNSIPEMTVAENIFIGRENCHSKTSFVDFKCLNKRAKELLDYLDINISPEAKLKNLTVASCQMIEIAKAVSYDSQIIIMDEPTSAISEREVEKLFSIIKSLTSKGVSIIYISHRMEEIYQIANTITVLRDGNYIDTKPAEELSSQSLISMMVGRELKDFFPKEVCEKGQKAMEVKGLTRKGVFSNISFNVLEGEILGFAGLMGAGRTEVAESIFGIRDIDEGEIFIKGKKVRINSPIDAKRLGIALVPEDRKSFGLNLSGSVKDNILISVLKRVNRKLFIREKKLNKLVDEQIPLLSIKTPDRNQIVESLSGGNQQKVVLAKWLLTKPRILILDEPTRGIDVGAKAEIHKLMNSLVKGGIAIILISSELPEVLGMSDRILVFSEGKMTAELSREEASQEEILRYATPGMGAGR